MIAGLKNALLSLVLPVECQVCGREVENSDNGVACEVCWETTRIFTGIEMLCSKCGAFFDSRSAPLPVSCPHCADHHYDRASAIGIYEKAMAASVLRLKAEPLIPLRISLAVASSISKLDLTDINLIIPIPLSKQRLIERGFNQAEKIASVVSEITGIEVDARSLARKSHTVMHRVGMDKRARELTVVGAFEVARPRLIEGKNILLVDDVFTSGSTSSFCAKALKKCGAERVEVFTLARAVLK